MTAVASPPSFQQNSRTAWGSNVGQGSLNAMNADDVARMFMPRKSVQRANSSSSISSLSSTSSNSSTGSTGTIGQPAPQTNGVPMTPSEGWGTAAARKKPQRAGPWPPGKTEPVAGTPGPRQASTLQNGVAPNSIHQTNSVLPSQRMAPLPNPQANGVRPAAPPVGEESPVLYLLSMNGTFERKTISVPFYPDRLRIGRQTNAKTVPAPGNAFFDSKVLSRQHAEIWADRNGKVWIRDVKSSNGTFVNGARLSAEARESEPHELQTQDHLELGIDIVSEDQKTVVHHKVAAKVEHAGFLAPTNNVLDMNFGDLDPANGTMMVPSPGSLQMRARTASQGSVGSNGRLGPPISTAGSQMSAMGQQRPMNFWLTPVTTEQIVKRLTLEMRSARLQMNELGRADNFFGSLLSKDDVKEPPKQPSVEAPKPAQINGNSPPFRTDISPRFSDPPAPPPQQPLPEKPDIARSNPADPNSPSSLKRANTERPRSITGSSPTREQGSSQIIVLVEALASAKKELEMQGAKLRDLEEILQKERRAREMAEAVVKRLEMESEAKMNGHAKGGEALYLEESFEPPAELSEPEKEVELENIEIEEKAVDPVAISDSSSLLEKRMEMMLDEMKELKEQIDSFKSRAENAEAERDIDRKTLAEMVEKIRLEESVRRSSSTERARSPNRQLSAEAAGNAVSDLNDSALGNLLSDAGLDGASPDASTQGGALGQTMVGILSKPNSGRDPLLYNTTPYASMLGVVLVGMGLMAYLNGWQQPKVDGR